MINRTFTAATIPDLLRQHPRWVVWDLDGAGKKSPRAAWKHDTAIDAGKAKHWSPFPAAVDAGIKNQIGIGFALGDVQDGPSFAGIDLDKCRNPTTGIIDDWALKIIGIFNSYTEVSPSGRGVKIFILGRLPDGAKQGKAYKIEIYDRARFFTVTGNHLPGTPTTVEDRTAQLQDFHAGVWSGDLRKLVRVFGFYISDGGEFLNVRCPWADHHSTTDGDRDAGLYLKDGQVSGFQCFHAGCADKTIGDVYQFFGLRGGHSHDFETHDGRVVAKSQENIRRAIALLGVTLEHDVFADQLYLSTTNGRKPIKNATADQLYLDIEATYRFSPPRDYFLMVVEAHARAHPFHPVLTCLNNLTWDGVSRVNRWLVTYGSAVDSAYVQQVGAKTLIAAVRRARIPGIKHDEMLVVESGQGLQKSSALAMLCPNPEWFSDDLPLNLDAKQIIERTSGKWIIEASDLAGMRKSDVEHLKAMLSRSVDGPVRMAYGHFAEARARSFIIIGTTNSTKYLKDSTGNRRFWPVSVQKFDLDALRRDRDQLWAEAAHREAEGESNRLGSAHWEAAALAQMDRQINDDWLEVLAERLGCNGDPDKPTFIPQVPMDRLLLEQVWALLHVRTAQRGPAESVRLEATMQALGYSKKQARGFGEPEEFTTADGELTTDYKGSAKRWCRESEGGN